MQVPPVNSVADEAYLEWLARNGVVLNGVTLGQFPEGRGVVALRPLSRGDVVVSVPDDMVLLAETGVASRALARAGLVGHVRWGRSFSLLGNTAAH